MPRHLILTLLGFCLGLMICLVALTFIVLPKPAPAPVKAIESTGKTPTLITSARALISVYLDPAGQEHLVVAKNADQALPIASITKLMTALTAQRLYDQNKLLTVTADTLLPNEPDPGFFRPGDQFTVGSLFYPLLVESSNNAAMILAAVVGQEHFVSEMNSLAKKLKMTSAHYYNPSGLDPTASGQGVNVATAHDLATLGLYLVTKQQALLNITTLEGYQLFDANGNFHHALNNTDQLLGYSSWPAEIVGGKTGTTGLAKKNLLLILRDRQSGGYLINVVLGSDDNFADMAALVNWLYASYRFK